MVLLHKLFTVVLINLDMLWSSVKIKLKLKSLICARSPFQCNACLRNETKRHIGHKMWVTLHKRSGISHLIILRLCSHSHDIFLDCLFFFQTGISPPRDNFLSLYHWYRFTVSASMIRREPSSIFVIFIRHLEGIWGHHLQTQVDDGT